MTIQFIYTKWRVKKWRFRFVADNGQVVGNSAQSYYNRQDCVDTVTGLQKNLPHARIEHIGVK